jgi:hypothetical protein
MLNAIEVLTLDLDVKAMGLVDKRPMFDGGQWLFRFDNGYGASVIRHRGSYGVELAVIKFCEDGDYKIVYDTPVTSDVIGHLDRETLIDTLKAIEDL